MLKKLIDSLKLPEIKNINDLDHFSTSELHAKIIQQKPFLKNLYLDFYKEFYRVIEKNPQGTYCEIGSGGGFLKQVYPQVITSDILTVGNVDLCCDAQALPFRESTLDGIFLINVLHHINDPQKFFKEINRCLKPDGTLLMIEPANTAWARFVYQRFHHEPFDPQAGWRVEGQGPLSCANGALPWIIFERDKEKFLSEFPGFCLKKLKYMMPFRYLISGGLTLKQLVPSCFYPLVKVLEWILTPINRLIAMFFVVNIQKKN